MEEEEGGEEAHQDASMEGQPRTLQAQEQHGDTWLVYVGVNGDSPLSPLSLCSSICHSWGSPGVKPAGGGDRTRGRGSDTHTHTEG